MVESDPSNRQPLDENDGKSTAMAVIYALFVGVFLIVGLCHFVWGDEPIWYRSGVIATQWIPIYLLYAPNRKVTQYTFLICLAIVFSLTGLLWWSERFIIRPVRGSDSTIVLMLGVLTGIGTFGLYPAWKGKAAILRTNEANQGD